MKIQRYILSLLFVMFATLSMAQSKTVIGVVIEDGINEPIFGANVVVINQQNRTLTGTTTDMDGNYVLNVPEGKNLRIQFSFIGLKSQVFDYTGQTKLDVTLVDDSKMLSDVEIVQKQITRNELGLTELQQTSSTQKIQMSELTDVAPVASIEEALQGQIAGMDIVLGGDPGAKSSIRIRGVSTLSSSAEPLVVVDDVPTTVSFGDDFSFSDANEEDFGALLNISPADIESIEVLKDAAATSIYGTAGANGVLKISTKQGKSGKTNFNFQSKFSYKEEPATIPLLNGKQYISMIEDAIWNAANAKGLGNATSELGLLFNTKELLRDPSYRYYKEYNVDTDWLSEVRQNAWQWDNSLSMNGGGDKAIYRMSFGYLDDVGTTIGTEAKRITASAKITYKFSDRFRVFTDLSYTDYDKEANAVENIRAKAQAMMPNQSPYLMNDDGTRSDSYFTPTSNFQGSFTEIDSDNKGVGNWNPVAMAKEGFKNTRERNEKITINWEYKVPLREQWQRLTYTGYVSMNMKTSTTKRFVPQVATGVLWTDTYANRSQESTSDAFSLQLYNRLLYIVTLAEKHNIVATGIFNTSSSQSSSTSNITYGNASQNLSDPTVGSVVASTSSGESQSRSVRFTGSLNYSYDNRYVVSATVTEEGNSSMGRNRRFGTFPSFGASWNLDREHFVEDYDWLTTAKLRGSLGWSGNAPSSGYYYLGAYSTVGTYGTMSAIAQSRPQLDKLKWESKREWDLGFDLLFMDRYGMTFDYYDNYTIDGLMKDVSSPSYIGFSSVKWLNSGEMSNKGWELRFDIEAYRSKMWSVKFGVNAARNINKVEKLPTNWSQENYTFGNGNYAVRILEGDPIGSFYGYKYLGVYKNTEDTYAYDANGGVMQDFNGNVVKMKNGTTSVYPGDAKYEDINHDGVIDEQDIVYLGNSNPTLTGGGNLSVRYGSTKSSFGLFTFSMNCNFRIGQKVINSARMSLESMYGTGNQSTAVLRRWRKEGDDTDIPRALYGMGYNYLGSDRFVEDASYCRIKTLSLSWSMPKQWVERAHFSSCSIFLTGYDLFTFTNYSGQNPEVSLPSSPTKLVKDGNTTPVSKRFACGVNLNF
ncbi:MAG: SusC/RagA family TonB-linked outer membrane protein [Bacteroidales bacterium]|nr:SusC/RagA family TonB-linked outer membrane protein [Bacteroidales bacterium]